MNKEIKVGDILIYKPLDKLCIIKNIEDSATGSLFYGTQHLTSGVFYDSSRISYYSRQEIEKYFNYIGKSELAKILYL